MDRVGIDMLEFIGVIAILIACIYLAVTGWAFILMSGFSSDNHGVAIGLSMWVVDIILIWSLLGDRIVLLFTGG